MGNGNSIIEQSYKDFETIDNKSNQAYGDFKLLNNSKTLQQLALKKVISDNSSDIIKQHNIAIKYENSRNPYLISGKSFLKSSESICSKFYKLSMYFEYLDKNLANIKSLDKSHSMEMSEYNHKMDSFDGIFTKDFSEHDYLQVVYCASGALEFIHSQDRYHGSINPWTILVAPDNYKLADHMLLNGIDGFTQLLTNPSSKVYLSPELFECLNKEDHCNTVNMQKADIFSLGFTILCIVKNLKPDIFYNFHYCTFNKELLNSHFQTLSFSNSKDFNYLLSKMLEINPRDRFSAINVTDYINKCFGRDNWGKMAFSRIEKANELKYSPVSQKIEKENFDSIIGDNLQYSQNQKEEPIDNPENSEEFEKKIRMYYYPPEPPILIAKEQNQIQSYTPVSLPVLNYPPEQRNLIPSSTLYTNRITYQPYQNYVPISQTKNHIHKLKSEIDELDNKLNNMMSKTSVYSNQRNNFQYF